ncbi:IS110 family transposase [Bradyrhizobium sp. Pear77]|uniref:IS110 family transposase n=1 Tax=Bradyrhizobium altum TaxID=1571202 RepID=UPI001E3799B4|nr:IS110 family transposase [Bradyrhizobium altum]MCC8960638.1 IS110 family transposase [Bradyrhizobium altum]
MNYFAGLDVSLRLTAICVVDGDGNVVREGVADTEPEMLVSWLKDTGLAFSRIGLEAGQCSSWLHKGLALAGFPVVCVETRHAKGVMQAQSVKTDRNDARALAQMMRTGWFKAVHIKGEDSQKLRTLMGSRRCLLDKQRDVDNHIRASLRVFGFKVGLIGQSRFEERVRELIAGDDDLEVGIVALLDARRALQGQVRLLTRIIEGLARKDEICRRLMTAPGVGPLTALAFKTAIDDPVRFAKSRNVAVHLGLTPRKYASGEVDYNGGITRCGDDFVRKHLYEAAHSLLVNTKRWFALKAWGVRLAKRSSFKNACVAVARKLAVILHRMWIDGTDFRWGHEEQAAAA